MTWKCVWGTFGSNSWNVFLSLIRSSVGIIMVGKIVCYKVYRNNDKLKTILYVAKMSILLLYPSFIWCFLVSTTHLYNVFSNEQLFLIVINGGNHIVLFWITELIIEYSAYVILNQQPILRYFSMRKMSSFISRHNPTITLLIRIELPVNYKNLAY